MPATSPTNADARGAPARRTAALASLAAGAAALSACSPVVRVEAPREPIEINLNVKIDQTVRIKLDREVEDLIADNPDLF